MCACPGAATRLRPIRKSRPCSALLNDNSAWPVFVHCRRGADRTGTAIACYRIEHDHWTNQQALAEAKTFGMSSMEVGDAALHPAFRAATPASRRSNPRRATAPHPLMRLQTGLVAALLGSSVLLCCAQESMMLPENSVTRVSEHVYAIVGFPNIGIVVGDRATLVVDTGLGARNGAIVMKQAEKLGKAPILYLTTTHFHPEHAMGEQAFPPRTVIIRPAVQQDEMNKHATELMDLFRGFSAQSKELLAGCKAPHARHPFDKELKLDLGGVTARLFWWGPAHTQGDEMIFVEQDSVLIPATSCRTKSSPTCPTPTPA